ncbi:hypothetical protein ACLE20_14225 [Rhizobium sp. YIM 134829]|uniref:hypothetical protein n=1 Tax=Rhizobium sp. YIM 134829 TaxID=3390453 RepID=UPI00397B5755
MRDDKQPTAAQVRGAIQAGETGDIREGFDPAAAPMETDGEAGGSPMSPEQAQLALDTQRRPRREENQNNYDTAMRKPGSMETKPQGGTSPGFILRLVGFFVLGAAVIVALVLALA